MKPRKLICYHVVIEVTIATHKEAKKAPEYKNPTVCRVLSVCIGMRSVIGVGVHLRHDSALLH